MDSITEVSSQGWLSRLMESIKGVLTGIILFLIAFPLLFWSEGRAVKRAQDLTEGKGAVVAVSADKVEAGNEGKLVHLSGLATTDETLTDEEFAVSSESTIALRRVVEMYQWQQNEKTETKKKAGGKKETKTTYSYEKVWSSSVINSSEFKTAEGHQNPGEMAFQAKEERAGTVTIGAFNLGSLASSITSWAKLPATHEQTSSAGRPLLNVDGGYYFGEDPGQPEIGDQRISFEIIKPTTVSIVAVQSGDTFTAFKGSSGSDIFRLSEGEHTSEQMFEAMESENTMMLWVLRLVGFLLMFGGISMVFKPLVVVADVIPFFGSLMSGGVSLLAFVIAAPLTLITIAIGWIAYRPVIGISLLVLAGAVIGGGLYLAKKNKG
jgi:hypothetical protein